MQKGLERSNLRNSFKVAVSGEESQVVLDCHGCDPKVIVRDGCSSVLELNEEACVLVAGIFVWIENANCCAINESGQNGFVLS